MTHLTYGTEIAVDYNGANGPPLPFAYWEGFPPYREKREGVMKRRERAVDAFKKFDDERKFKTAC